LVPIGRFSLEYLQLQLSIVQFISISNPEAERTARLPPTGLAKLNIRAENLKSTPGSQTSRAEGAAPHCKNALIKAAQSLVIRNLL
jgi:hypothetical protein